MTPTLAQLKRRPALWVLGAGGFIAELRITEPNGIAWMWIINDWVLLPPNEWAWHKFAIKELEKPE